MSEEKIEKNEKNDTIDPILNIEQKIEQNEQKIDNSDIFIKDDDTFNIRIRYYKQDKNIIVENIDSEFDENFKNIKSFDITFKYPSYQDMLAIYNNVTLQNKEDFSIKDLLALQDARIIILFKSWTLPEKQDSIYKMNIKILKAIRTAIYNNIGMEGIL